MNRPMTLQEKAQYCFESAPKDKLEELVGRLSERLNMAPQDVVFKLQMLAKFGVV